MIYLKFEYIYDNPKHLNDLVVGDRKIAVIMKFSSKPVVEQFGLDREKLGTRCKDKRGDLTE